MYSTVERCMFINVSYCNICCFLGLFAHSLHQLFHGIIYLALFRFVFCTSFVKKAGLGICSSVFWANQSFFVKKLVNEQFAHKKTSDSLFFGEWPERFAHGRSFLVSDLNDLLMVAHFSWATWANHSWSLILKWTTTGSF